MKNIRNIIEQKYPPENPNDLWMKDNVLYKSTHKGWTPLTVGGGSSTNGVTSTTWLELKDKRDAGKLTPGALYRITDYNCTTTQENTKSAGHQFDIVLLALSENKLAEEGWAMMHDNIYDVTFADGVTKKCYITINNDEEVNIVDVETGLGYENMSSTAIEINENNKTAICQRPLSSLDEEDVTYNYFQNSNLSAWKVWYCLDNDKSRFAWADDREGYYISGQSQLGIWDNRLVLRAPGWDSDDLYGWQIVGTEVGIWTKTLDINVGQLQIYNSSGELIGVATVSSAIKVHNGRGVIYRLIDEWNNDVGYDFKNVQFYNGKGWHAPFCDGEEHTRDASLDGTFANNKVIPNGEGLLGIISNNTYDVKGCIFVHTDQINPFQPDDNAYNAIIKDGSDLRLW